MRTGLELAVQCDHEVGCITCGDEAVEMRVVTIDAARGLALCADANGSRSSVETALLDELEEGDAVLVHAGVALQLLSKDAA